MSDTARRIVLVAAQTCTEDISEVAAPVLTISPSGVTRTSDVSGAVPELAAAEALRAGGNVATGELPAKLVA